jgi:hypothetical protein
MNLSRDKSELRYNDFLLLRGIPAAAFDPQYILRLIGQVLTASLETQRIISTLPSLNLPA